jgi:hypothetical protein
MIKKMKYTLRDTRFILEQRLDKARLVFQGWWNTNSVIWVQRMAYSILDESIYQMSQNEPSTTY